MSSPLHAQDAAAPPSDPNLIVIHYHRFDGNYEQPGLWTWDARSQKQPTDQELLPAGKTDFGVYFVLDRRLYGNDDGEADRVGFIPRTNKDWNLKDGTDRFWSPTTGRELWLIGNDPKLYTERPNLAPHVVTGYIDSPRAIIVKLSHAIKTTAIGAAAFAVKGADGTAVPVSGSGAYNAKDGETMFVELALGADLDLAKGPFTISATNYEGAKAVPRRLLDNPSLFGTADPLGAVYTKEKTTFRLFSPTAEAISVLLFDEAVGSKGRREVAMKPVGKGVWEAAVDGDLEGRFYRLKVRTARYGEQELIDPWATNTTGDDGNARITNLRALDPPGFRPVKRPFESGAMVDAIIYQLHIRDFSISPTSGVPDQHRGRYLGFVQPGTTLPADAGIKTTIDHLKELGVTHVQLLPLQDFDNVESKPDYGWGYMTAFFNSPDGYYASDIRNTSRVAEYKQLVKGLKDAGIGVIMDVVYNHTGNQNTLEHVAPGYYLRQRDDGSFWNGSGTGNEFRSESPMGRRFIVDSCKFWVDEYGVDGFRFDLMGLTDLDTMLAVKAELKKIDPRILLYGEPWAATSPENTGPGKILDKAIVKGTGLTAFNDHFRDAIKGSTEGDDGGYVQDGSRRDGVIRGIAGSIDDWSASPSEVVNYVSVHDNLALWDKLEASAKGVPEAERTKMVKMAGAILCVSQGAMLLHGGSDFCHYKFGEKNSYNSGDKINQVDWSRKKTYLAVNEYFRGMIALRKAHPVFRLRTAEEVHKRLKFHEKNLPVPEALTFSLDGEGVEGETWKNVVVLINPSEKKQTFAIPLGGDFKIFVQGGKVSATPLGEIGEFIEVEGRSTVLLARE